ncbi:MAG: DNA topoisomerase 3 [Spirochaetaceae bacterium]|nr:DNA topoisomerase 3 [Spirochaetaceae bacterium]
MKLVLAEKPSVGRTLATALGCNHRENGYSEGNGYIVTWALGHLVELSQPATYGSQYKRWSFGSLPILPKTLEVEPIENTKEQYKIVKALLERKDIENFIIATDAGREGELVARWILKLSSYDKKIQRLWISSQTDSAIKEGFANLKDGDEYINLYKAAECRASADWYVGMNVTRALTTHFDAKMSAGRVQTPTLAIMCNREEQIEQFEGNFYWTLKADFGGFNCSYYTEQDTIRIDKEIKVNDLISKLNKQSGIVEKIEVAEKSDHSPLAYDLTELQRDANLSLGFSAKKTLDVLQKLYEYHKIVTYPRTDSRYITHDIVETIPSRLMALVNTPFSSKARFLANGNMHIDKDRFVNDELVSDHHAIIPTDQRVNLSRLSEDEKNLWQLIVIRFLEVLEDDYKYKTTSMIIKVKDEIFKSRITIPISQGYRDIARIVGLRSTASIDDGDDSSFIDNLKENDIVTIKSIMSHRTTTEAPKRYNDATLLSAMEHAGRFVEDYNIKKNLSAGLGTPATRADIIEKLIHNNYIDRSKDNELIPTPRGREIVRLAPSLLTSPELTGLWEERLSKIAKGKEDSNIFIKDIKQVARDLVSIVGKSTDSFSPVFEDVKKCPFCESLMMSILDENNRKHYVCQKLSCSYEEMEIQKRVLLSEQEIAEYKSKIPKQTVVKVKIVAKKKVIVKKSTAIVRQKVQLIPTENTKVASSASSSAAYFSSLASSKSSLVPGISRKNTFVKPESTTIIPTYKYETQIEVVRESNFNRYKKNQNNQKSKTEITDWINNKNEHSLENNDGGSTFADFIKVSENRNKKREQKNK